MGNRRYKVKLNIDTKNENNIGTRYNYLTLVRTNHYINGAKRITCKCDCGNFIEINPFNWKSGRTKSCGCMTKKLLSDAFSKLIHTEDLDRLRRIYNGMKCRCYNENTRNYRNYGARGIGICDEWLADREAFIRWSLSHGYRSDLSIDRIDVDGNYEPGNCRWATAKEQRENIRPRDVNSYRNKFTINGITKPAIQWCAEYGVSVPYVMYRVRRMGMDPLDALTIPKITTGRPAKP